MNKFWNWQVINKNDETTGGTQRELRLEGAITENDWFNGVTPKMFRDELNAGQGDITVWINSPGGDVFAASQIYTMLKEYKGNVAVKIDGIAASAASVIAMAGEEIYMSPTSYIFIHDPETSSTGNIAEMQETIEMLLEIKEGIINAYEIKTKLPRDEISKLMSAAILMNAKKAIELGFADEILYRDD